MTFSPATSVRVISLELDPRHGHRRCSGSKTVSCSQRKALHVRRKCVGDDQFLRRHAVMDSDRPPSSELRTLTSYALMDFFFAERARRQPPDRDHKCPQAMPSLVWIDGSTRRLGRSVPGTHPLNRTDYAPPQPGGIPGSSWLEFASIEQAASPLRHKHAIIFGLLANRGLVVSVRALVRQRPVQRFVVEDF